LRKCENAVRGLRATLDGVSIFESSYRRFRQREGQDPRKLVPTQDRPEYIEALWSYLTTDGGSPAFRHSEQFAALAVGADATGGYLVPTDLEQAILHVARTRGTISRLAAEHRTEGHGRPLKLPKTTAHGVAAWVAEGAGFPNVIDTFGILELDAFKAGTLELVSEELWHDVDGFEDYLTSTIGARLAVLEGAAFVNGTGSGQPTGFLANITALQAPTGNSTTFRYDDVVNVLHEVPVGYREPLAVGGASDDLGSAPSWVVSDSALKALRLVRDTAGAPILLERTEPGRPHMMLGYPLYVDANMPATGANAKSVAFGNWKLAYAIRRSGLVIARPLVELYSGNGQIGYRVYERVDGNVMIADAARALQHSAT
jgi:HK97 family phage major capsid protein